NPPSRFLAEIDGQFELDSIGLGGAAWQQASEFRSQSSEERFQNSDFELQDSNQEPQYIPELNEGDNVRHDVFGEGTVMEVEGDIIVVYFKGKGAKTINIAFAPIRKL